MEHLMAAARFKCPAERESTRRDEFLILHLMANRKTFALEARACACSTPGSKSGFDSQPVTWRTIVTVIRSNATVDF